LFGEKKRKHKKKKKKKPKNNKQYLLQNETKNLVLNKDVPKRHEIDKRHLSASACEQACVDAIERLLFAHWRRAPSSFHSRYSDQHWKHYKQTKNSINHINTFEIPATSVRAYDDDCDCCMMVNSCAPAAAVPSVNGRVFGCCAFERPRPPRRRGFGGMIFQF
jgi:hypothetical protein